MVACSRTAKACARCPVARKAWAYCVAFVTSSGRALYSASHFSNSLRHPASLVGRGTLAIQPVVSGLLVVLQTASPTAAKIVSAVEAIRRDGAIEANRMAIGHGSGRIRMRPPAFSNKALTLMRG